MQTKMKARYHIIPVRMTCKSKNQLVLGGYDGKNSSFIIGGAGVVSVENSMKISKTDTPVHLDTIETPEKDLCRCV